MGVPHPSSICMNPTQTKARPAGRLALITMRRLSLSIPRHSVVWVCGGREFRTLAQAPREVLRGGGGYRKFPSRHFSSTFFLSPTLDHNQAWRKGWCHPNRGPLKYLSPPCRWAPGPRCLLWPRAPTPQTGVYGKPSTELPEEEEGGGLPSPPFGFSPVWDTGT